MLALRKPASRNGTRWRAKIHAAPAPVGGWNKRDSVTIMPESDALVLDNMIPTAQGVVLRKGHAAHVTGLAGLYVETLMTYSPNSGNDELFAADPTAIYDVSAAGAVGAAVQSGFANGRWSWTNFSTLGANYLTCVNGANAPRAYDGSSWTLPAWSSSPSGPTTVTDWTFVTQHVARLWFIERAKLSVWFGAVGAISGATTELDFGPLCRLGGFMLAMASWSRDGGAGLDDLAVFITSKGEALIYSGYDPTDANTWSLVGIFRIPEPIGRNCVVKIGADIGILTAQGLVPLSSIMAVSSSEGAKVASTDKISGAYAEVYATAKNSYGWQVVESPTDQLVVVNLPVRERVEAYQYVMHSQTGSWCRWTGMDANCWGLFEGELYFGGNDGVVYKYHGTTDDGSAVEGLVAHAYSPMGSPMTKVFDRVKPVLFGPSNYSPGVAMLTDYDENIVVLPATAYTGEGPAWDEVYWDEEYWADAQVAVLAWHGVTGEGLVGSVVCSVASTEALTYNGALISYRTGGPI